MNLKGRHFLTLKDYSPEDYKKLESLILKKHTLDVGILLQRKVHKKFHSLYGIRNNTIEQFEEFIKNYYPQFQLNKEKRDYLSYQFPRG